jgi:hypothetical protein
MHARTTATLFAAGRIAFGAGMLFAPRKVAHGWIGDDADRASAEFLTRAVGIRDIIIGAGAMFALASGKPAQAWMRAGVAADVADSALTAAYLGKLPRQGALVTMAITISAAYAGNRLAGRVS